MGLPYLQYVLLESFWNASDQLSKNGEDASYLTLLVNYQKGDLSDIVTKQQGAQERRKAFRPYPGQSDSNVVLW